MNIISALRSDGMAAFFVHTLGSGFCVDASMPISDQKLARTVAEKLGFELLLE